MVTEVPILQLTNTVAIYKYSDAILKTYGKWCIENFSKQLVVF